MRNSSHNISAKCCLYSSLSHTCLVSWSSVSTVRIKAPAFDACAQELWATVRALLRLLTQGPNLGCMYPWGYHCVSEGVHLLCSRNRSTFRHKNGVYISCSENTNVILNIQLIFLISFRLSVATNFKGTCSSVETLQGCVVRESLGTPCFNRFTRSKGKEGVWVLFLSICYSEASKLFSNCCLNFLVNIV